jgi:hypothetical protein
MRRWTALAIALSLAACSSSSGGDVDTGTSPGTDSGTPGSDSGTPGTDSGLPGTDSGLPPTDAGPAGDCITLSYPAVDVNPGVENTQCVVMNLHNATQLRVGSIHNVLGPASHHFIVYRTNETTERPTPFDCQPFADTLNPMAGSPIMITQRHDDTLTLPSGVAYTFQPNQMIRLELHYINPTAAPETASPTATFCPIAESSFHDEADFLFIGNPDINIPAHSSFTLGPTFFPMPAEFADAHFFAITGHEHQWGTNVRISTGPSASGPFTSVYDVPSWSWSEPTTVMADPAFTLPAGGGFQFTCDWFNGSDANVRFGESANDEMCFFWAYYYPSHGARVCIHTSRAGGVDACCPGDAICSLIGL